MWGKFIANYAVLFQWYLSFVSSHMVKEWVRNEFLNQCSNRYLISLKDLKCDVFEYLTLVIYDVL